MAASDSQIARRRAIEALRSGVPSWAAVSALGSAQGEIEDRFLDLLERVRDPAPTAPAGGLLVSGGFGAGKSHLLEHLAHLALDDGFVVSRVVVSKETPLHDPIKVFRAAVESAVPPGGHGEALVEAAAALDPEELAFSELSRWAADPRSEVNERFAATLLLFARSGATDTELADLVVRFWSGDPVRVADLRRRLKEVGERRYPLPAVGVRELARQRLRFAARVFRAAGWAGWLVLFDEVELIGRCSVLQRARSYAELARWTDGDPDDRAAPLGAVLAITDDYEAAVLSGKSDREQVPARMRGRGSVADDLLADGAEAGMRAIEQQALLLSPPDDAELDATYRRLKELHGEAYGWDPPDVAGLQRLGATRMRQYVRAWINEWDLIRLDPAFTPASQLATDAVAPPDYTEDPDLDPDDPPDPDDAAA